MKVYVATRYKGAANKHEVEALCKAVRDAGLKDFSFVRDVEHYEKKFDNPRQLWAKAQDEIGACDAILIDVSDNPTGGRVIEAGMAYALGKTVMVVKRHGVQHKPIFDGISSTIITYRDLADLTKQLGHFDRDHSFDMTDKTLVLTILLSVGIAISYAVSLFWIPLGALAAVVYWLIIRHFFTTVRMYDRVVIYIPLAALWIGGYAWLSSIDVTFALAWGIIFWIVVLPLLQRGKFSL